jgi:hypothetical protein
MKKFVIYGILLAAPIFTAGAASALTGVPAIPSSQQHLIEVKGGHGHGGGHGWGRGHGGGHGWGRGHGNRSFGWSRGRKVGWGGRHCPPGLWKQGRC